MNQISGLMRGLAGAAVLPGPRDFRVCRFAYAVLHCAMIPVPFIMLWSVTLLAGQISSSTNGVGQSLLRPIVQLNALLFEPALERLSWLPGAYWKLILVLVLTVLAVHVMGNELQGALAALRKCVACLLWPLVYAIALCVSWPGALCAALYVFGITVDQSSRAMNEVTITADGVIVAGLSMTAFVLSAYSTALLSLGTALAILIAARLLLWMFKVFADVMCFAGDPLYAKTLIDYVRDQFSKASVKADDNVVIVGYSLGSAICVKCLLGQPKPFPRTTRLFLVTLGSPINRLLARFFPAIMAKADSAAAQLNVRYPRFRWINIYRPFDPIGGSLFSKSDLEFARDIRTEQYRKVFLQAHAKYWDDEKVIDAVHSAIIEVRALEQISWQTGDGRNFVDTAAPTTPLLIRLNCFLGASGWYSSAVVLALLTLVTVNSVHSIHQSTAASNTARLKSAGKVTDDAWLYTYDEIIPGGRDEPLDSVDYYVVAFRPAGAVNKIARRVDPLTVRGRLNFEKGQPVKVKQRLGLSDKSAIRIPIQVRYLPNDPTVFDFPALRPKSFSDTPMHELMLRFVFILWATPLGLSLFWLLPIYFGVYSPRRIPGKPRAELNKGA